VWRAMDLYNATEVAVKVHQLSQSWTEQRRQSYIRHASREYQIHRQLKHPNIVELHDVFEISSDAFATVLEYCGGTDLDRLLKQHSCLPEREARTIVLQVLAALRYMNQVGTFPSTGGYDESFALAAEAIRSSTPTGGRTSRGSRGTRVLSGTASTSGGKASKGGSAWEETGGKGSAGGASASPLVGTARTPSPAGLPPISLHGGVRGSGGGGGTLLSGMSHRQGASAGQERGLQAMEVPLASMMMAPDEQGHGHGHGHVATDSDELAPGTLHPNMAGAPSSPVGVGRGGSAGQGTVPEADSLLGRRVIHFDLKPANILLTDDRMVKVTDFGLSKIFEDRDRGRAGAASGSSSGIGGGEGLGSPGRDGGAIAAARMQHSAAEMTSMELTSQGAGTYWYLPPECFQFSAGNPPRISDKVDVWSVGVIFYQMLYGRRPFAEGRTQEEIYREKLILNAKAVEFPPLAKGKPAISQAAQKFIRRCLTFDQKSRPGIRDISSDDYLRIKLSGK